MTVTTTVPRRPPTYLELLADTGLLPADTPVLHTTGGVNPAIHTSDRCTRLRRRAGTVSWRTTLLADLAELMRTPDPTTGDLPDPCVCTHDLDKKHERPTPEPVAGALAWIQSSGVFDTFTAASVRVAQARNELSERPEPTGYPRIDACVEGWSGLLQTQLTTLLESEEYLDELADTLAEGWGAWRTTDSDKASWQRVLEVIGPAPDDGAVPGFFDRRRADLVWVGLVRQFTTHRSPLATASLVDHGGGNEATLALVPSAVVAFDDFYTVPLCRDRGYTTAEVRSAANVATGDVDFHQLIAALRSTSL